MGLKPRKASSPNPEKPRAATLLSEERFWQVIAASLGDGDASGRSLSQHHDSLVRELERLSRHELLGYEAHLSRFFHRAYKDALWAVAYIVMGGCGTDAFMDFRMWLVTRGKPVYDAALRDHESLVEEFDKIPDGDIPLWEDAMGLARKVFDARFGDGSYDREETLYEFERPEGPLERLDFTWSSDDESSLQRVCPKTFARWWDNDRF